MRVLYLFFTTILTLTCSTVSYAEEENAPLSSREHFLHTQRILNSMTPEEELEVYDQHKKNVRSKYKELTISDELREIIRNSSSYMDFTTTDPATGLDPCEDRAIRVGGEDGAHLGFDKDLDDLCKKILQLYGERERETHQPSLITFNFNGNYTVSYHDTQIDFSTLYISKNDNGYVGIYIGNHSGFPLEKLAPENEIKESKVKNKTVIEEYAGNKLIRKQVRIETGNDYPAEITAWTMGALKGHELDEALGILDSLDRKLFNEDVKSAEDK